MRQKLRLEYEGEDYASSTLLGFLSVGIYRRRLGSWAGRTAKGRFSIACHFLSSAAPSLGLEDFGSLLMTFNEAFLSFLFHVVVQHVSWPVRSLICNTYHALLPALDLHGCLNHVLIDSLRYDFVNQAVGFFTCTSVFDYTDL